MPLIDPHRLPRWITPRRYTVELTPDLVAATFSGSVTIDATVVEPTDLIVVNAHALEISSIEVSGATVASHDLDSELQRLTIQLAEPISLGDVTLAIDYRGVLNDQLVGFYRSTYTDGDESHTIACSQFEAPFARQALPCWDEPDR